MIGGTTKPRRDSLEGSRRRDVTFANLTRESEGLFKHRAMRRRILPADHSGNSAFSFLQAPAHGMVSQG